MVFDVQMSAWSLRSCSTDGVKNALLISHFIKFNPLFFQKIKIIIIIMNEKMMEIELFWIA